MQGCVAGAMPHLVWNPVYFQRNFTDAYGHWYSDCINSGPLAGTIAGAIVSSTTCTHAMMHTNRHGTNRLLLWIFE